MNILKKILGLIIILFTFLLSCSFIYALKTTFLISRKKFEDGKIGAPGYTIGFIISLFLCLLIIYFLTRLSFKLLWKKKIDMKTINEIGTQE